MAESLTDRHNLYLSRTVWSELRRRAVLEERSASHIINAVLRAHLDQPLQPAPGRRPQPDWPQLAGQRTVYFAPGLYEAAEAHAREEGRSVSLMAEQLLRAYLSLEPLADGKPEPKIPNR